MINSFKSHNSIEFSGKTLKSMMLMSLSSVSMLGLSPVAYGQTSTASGVGFTCTSDTDQNFNLRPSSTPARSYGPNSWTYKKIMTLGGVNYDMKVTQVGARSNKNYVLDNTAEVSLKNWNPRLGPYVILEYKLLYSNTGQTATLNEFKFVQGDIDGQNFRTGLDDNMIEIIGFQTGQYDSISFGGKLGYRGFLNGKSTPGGYRTIRQANPKAISDTSHDIRISYSNKSSFRVLYGMTAKSNWTNNSSRNFFFRSFSGVIDANTVFPCSADYSDAPTTYGDTLHKIDNNLLLGASITGEDAAVNDGNAGSDDSDDGITIPALKQGESAVITANVTGASGYLQGWIDFNGNGTFEASEQVARDLQDGDSDGQISISVNVPSDAVKTQTFTRFRWSKTAGLDASTAAIDGEVEDYAVTIAPADADLVTLKTLSSSDNTPDEGDTVTFSIAVRNDGPGDASNVSLTDFLPNGLTATTNNGTTDDGSGNTVGTYDDTSGLWSIGSLANGATVTLILEGTVDTGQSSKTIQNVTTAATGSEGDPDDSTNDLTESVTVRTRADLSITKTNTPGINGDIDQTNDTLTSGATTSYTLTATNNGPDTVSDAIVKDLVVSGLTCTSTDAITITGDGVPVGSFTIGDLIGAGVTLGTLADGEKTIITYECEVN